MIPKIKTKFGVASISSDGYYRITNGENKSKALHRLIFEDFYKIKIPEGYIIHHKNENKLDNCILNLQMMSIGEHISLHHTGKSISEETKEKLRHGRIGEKSSWWGKKHTIETRLKQSKSLTSTGFYGVNKHKDKQCFNGFYWEYLYYDGKKQKSICSVDFFKLEKKVKSQGRLWKIVNEELAKQTLMEVCGDV